MNYSTNETKVDSKPEIKRSLKSLTSSNQSYGVDNEFTDDEGEILGDEETGLGIIKQFQGKRNLSGNLGSIKAEINNDSHLTSSRSITLV